MSINIKTTNIESGSEAESYLIKKLDLLKKFVDFTSDNVTAQAELAKSTNHHNKGGIFQAEINVRIGKVSFRAACEAEDIHTAIDDLKDDLERQITTEKDKHITSVRKGGAEIKEIARAEEANTDITDDDME